MSDQLTLEEAIENKNAILHLLAIDPAADPTHRAVAAALDKVACAGDVVSANTIRPHLPTWVKREQLGPAWARLVRAGAVVKLGWEASTDRGTHGKPVALYRVLGNATEAIAS